MREFRLDCDYYDEQGVTDVIKDTRADLTRDKESFDSIITEFGTDVETTSIKPHLLLNQFLSTTGVSHTLEQAEDIGGLLETVLSTHDWIRGVSFDDFHIWGAPPEDDHINTPFLREFATIIRDHIGNDIELSGGVTEDGGWNTAELSPLFDFIIPLIYRQGHTYPYLIRDGLQPFLNNASCEVCTGLMGFYTDTDMRLLPTDIMSHDIRQSLENKTGYFLFIDPYIQDNQTFPASNRQRLNNNRLTSKTRPLNHITGRFNKTGFNLFNTETATTPITKTFKEQYDSIIIMTPLLRGGEPYSLQYEINIPPDKTIGTTYWCQSDPEGTTITGDNKYTRYTHTRTFPDDCYAYFRWIYDGLQGEFDVTVRNLKIEEGSVATRYTEPII